MINKTNDEWVEIDFDLEKVKVIEQFYKTDGLHEVYDSEDNIDHAVMYDFDFMHDKHKINGEIYVTKKDSFLGGRFIIHENDGDITDSTDLMTLEQFKEFEEKVLTLFNRLTKD